MLPDCGVFTRTAALFLVLQFLSGTLPRAFSARLLGSFSTIGFPFSSQGVPCFSSWVPPSVLGRMWVFRRVSRFSQGRVLGALLRSFRIFASVPVGIWFFRGSFPEGIRASSPSCCSLNDVGVVVSSVHRMGPEIAPRSLLVLLLPGWVSGEHVCRLGSDLVGCRALDLLVSGG